MDLRSYKPRSNIVNDKNDNLLADSHDIATDTPNIDSFWIYGLIYWAVDKDPDYVLHFTIRHTSVYSQFFIAVPW
jgi:hypothetical protein